MSYTVARIVTDVGNYLVYSDIATNLSMLVGGSAGGDIHNIALALRALCRPDCMDYVCRAQLDGLGERQVRGYRVLEVVVMSALQFCSEIN
jgi:hypothetical protein